MTTDRRPYHLYPLLGLVLLAVAVAALMYRMKHPPSRQQSVHGPSSRR
ncbi:MAG: hypothetical protein QOE97_3518 [Pseudonocardiales bacterium]|jgi:hypothetical protein|nr:hypothetical protein [Pseudonocardiales bacterium]